MGWKNVKEFYRVKHIVQVTEEGICIGSPYIHNIIVIDNEGIIVKEDDRTLNDDLMRYQIEMKADLSKLRDLVKSDDTFTASITVYTYDGAEIIEKQCEELGWPNVTHDGYIQYENTFSPDREKVVAWAKKNCLSSIRFRQEMIEDRKQALEHEKVKLAEQLDIAAKLGLTPADFYEVRS